jgi:anaerobic selenocysteine-containing dehydrogenase
MLQHFATNLTAQPKYPINTLLIFEANPCYAAPEPDLFVQAINKVPFVVAFTAFLDETAKQADLVLPAPFYLETWNGITTPEGLQYPIFGVSKPVTQSLYDTKHPGDILLVMSKKISDSTAQALPWESFKEILKEVAQKIYSTGEGSLASVEVPTDFNTMWEKLSQCIWFNPEVKKEGFQTETGKFEFLPTKLSALNLPKKLSLPHYEVWKQKGSSEEYPLTLISYGKLMLQDGYMASSPFMVKVLPDTLLKGNDLLVEIHPETAAKYNLTEGDKILLNTSFGKAEIRVHLFEGIIPGLVAMPLGMGHSAYDEYLEGKGVNAHQLLGYSEEKTTGIATWAMAKTNLTKI